MKEKVAERFGTWKKKMYGTIKSVMCIEGIGNCCLCTSGPIFGHIYDTFMSSLALDVHRSAVKPKSVYHEGG